MALLGVDEAPLVLGARPVPEGVEPGVAQPADLPRAVHGAEEDLALGADHDVPLAGRAAAEELEAARAAAVLLEPAPVQQLGPQPAVRGAGGAAELLDGAVPPAQVGAGAPDLRQRPGLRLRRPADRLAAGRLDDPARPGRRAERRAELVAHALVGLEQLAGGARQDREGEAERHVRELGAQGLRRAREAGEGARLAADLVVDGLEAVERRAEAQRRDAAPGQ